MQAADDSHTVILADAQQQFQDAGAAGRVQAGHRLIGDDEFGLLGQRAGDRDPLLLAAAERVGALPGLGQQPDPVQAGQCQPAVRAIELAQPATPGRHMAQAAGQHVVQCRQAAHQIELLKDHRDTPALAALQRRDFSAGDAHLATLGPRQTGDALDQRRLAGTAGAEQRDELAAPHRQVDTVEHRATAEAVAQAAHIEQRRHHVSRLRSQPEKRSSSVTTMTITTMIVKSRGKSSKSMLLFNS